MHKPIVNAAKAGAALLAMSAALTGAVLAAPLAQPHAIDGMTLVGTDTNEAYPFASIVIGHTTYHVTEGDVLKGVHIRHIAPGRVTLSDDRVLVMQTVPRPDAWAQHAVAVGTHTH